MTLKRSFVSISFLLFVIASACEEKDCCSIQEEGRNDLTGSWLLYEWGYSPGAGYITENVSQIPPQTITFHDDGTISSSVDGWKPHLFYLVLSDPSQPDLSVLALFDTLPDQPVDINDLQNSYLITFDDGKLKLSFRWCVEGCHLGFRAI
jgi:hypothetical protein